MTDVSKRRITNEEVVKGSGVAIDVAAGVAFAFKLLSGGSSPKVNFPLKHVVNRDAFQRLVSLKNETSTSALYELMIRIPPPVRIKNMSIFLFIKVYIAVLFMPTKFLTGCIEELYRKSTASAL